MPTTLPLLVLVNYGTVLSKRLIFANSIKSSTVSTSTIISSINKALAYINTLGLEDYINIS